MKEINKQVNYEEFMKMMLECYSAFRDVMKTCGAEDKRVAIQGFNTLQRMMKAQVEEYEEKHGVNFHKVEELVIASKSILSEECLEVKERFSDLKRELDPVIEKIKVDKENARPKKSRKRKMENRIRAKE